MMPAANTASPRASGKGADGNPQQGLIALGIIAAGLVIALRTVIRLEPPAKKASSRRWVVVLPVRKPRSRAPIARVGWLRCHFRLTARRGAGEDDLGILRSLFLDQGIENGCIRRRDAHAAMRDGFAEKSSLHSCHEWHDHLS